MTVETSVDRALTIEVKGDGDTINITWQGKSTARDPAQFILPILSRAIDQANSEQKPIVMDFRSLEYMNSSTVTPLIRVLDQAKKAGMRVTILYNKALRWQALNFTALEVFHTDDKRIEIRGV
jgi:hypothetical protein